MVVYEWLILDCIRWWWGEEFQVLGHWGGPAVFGASVGHTFCCRAVPGQACEGAVLWHVEGGGARGVAPS